MLTPITAPESENFPQNSWADWENACLNGKNVQVNEAKAVTLAKFQQGALMTPAHHLQAILAGARRLYLASEEVDALLDLKLGREAPGLAPIKNLAGSVVGLLANVLEQRGAATNAADLKESKDKPKENPEEVRVPSAALGFSRIGNRTQAYQVLAEAADFLVRTEPHSPVPYLVRRAISWGEMSLETLMTDLIRNTNDLAEISRLLSFGETPKSKAK
jgi:type VI secretion system ImpA family protein